MGSTSQSIAPSHRLQGARMLHRRLPIQPKSIALEISPLKRAMASLLDISKGCMSICRLDDGQRAVGGKSLPPDEQCSCEKNSVVSAEVGHARLRLGRGDRPR